MKAASYGDLPEVGFEPTHPKITELKSAALDHSAIQAHIVPLNVGCARASACVCIEQNNTGSTNDGDLAKAFRIDPAP